MYSTPNRRRALFAGGLMAMLLLPVLVAAQEYGPAVEPTPEDRRTAEELACQFSGQCGEEASMEMRTERPPPLQQLQVRDQNPLFQDRHGYATGSTVAVEPGTRFCLFEGEEASVSLDGGSPVTLVGPTCLDVGGVSGIESRGFSVGSAARTKSAVRPAATAAKVGRKAASARPVEAVRYVIRGTAGALTRFPKGTRVAAGTRICLDKGDQITLTTADGVQSTLGQGCETPLTTTPTDQKPAATQGRLRRRDPVRRAESSTAP